MEQIIKETTEKLSKGIITQDEANKILLDLFGVSRRSEQLKQKFTQGQNVTVLSGEKPLLTSIKFIEFHDFHYSPVEFYDFHDCRGFGIEFLDFHGFLDFQLEFNDFHDF